MEQEIIVEKENLEQEIELENENITFGVFPEGTLDVDENGTYDVTDYANVDVNTPGIIPSGTINIIENGTHDVTNYANANVNVPGIIPTGVIDIKDNGTYDVTEYEEANVQTSGVDINEYFNTTIDSNSYRAINYLKKTPFFVITSNVTSLGYIFEQYNAVSNSHETIITGDVSNVTSVANMFRNAQNMSYITLQNLDFSHLTSLGLMFYNSSQNRLRAYNIVLGIATSDKLESIRLLFYNCNVTTTITGLENINTTNCNNFESAFYQCRTLTNLDLSSWETTVSFICNNMFYGCTTLAHLDMRKFLFTNATNFGDMFTNVPTTCEIIVKDTTQKTWFSTNFPNLTNVKTVEEYEEG